MYRNSLKKKQKKNTETDATIGESSDKTLKLMKKRISPNAEKVCEPNENKSNDGRND